MNAHLSQLLKSGQGLARKIRNTLGVNLLRHQIVADGHKNTRIFIIKNGNCWRQKTGTSEDPGPLLGVRLEAGGREDLGGATEDVGRESNRSQIAAEITAENVTLHDLAPRLKYKKTGFIHATKGPKGMESHHHQVATLVTDDKLDCLGQLENFFA